MGGLFAALDRWGKLAFFGRDRHARRKNRTAEPRRVCTLRLEPLEQRALLSASIQASPAALVSESVSTLQPVIRTESILPSGLQDVQRAIQGRMAEGKTSFQDLSTATVHVDNAGRIQVYVHVAEVTDAMIASLRSAGLAVETSNAGMRVVQGWASNSSLDVLANVAGVQAVAPPVYAITRTETTSAGDGILNADDVRNQFVAYGVDGSGIKVGVISGGVSQLAVAQATGDLPATVTVNSVGSGDEGTAMLEIVHDLAPGASLYFSAPSTSAEMVNAINYLADTQGCNVIVDDLGYYDDQPFFEDGTGTIAEAVNHVTSVHNVTYVTAAGNDALRHWQGMAAAGQGYQEYHAGDNTMRFSVPANGALSAILQWSDAWGSSTNDYNLDLLAWTGADWTYVGSFPETAGIPEAGGTYVNTSGYTTLGLRIWKANGAAIRELELYTPRNDTMDLDDTTAADSMFAQTAVTSAITVGAIRASEPGNDAVESSSSHGPSTIYSNFTTQTKNLRQSLDVCGIDGVSTAIGQTIYFTDPFYGTSAAAPHIAAIAALLLDANPNLTPAQVSTALSSTAVDLTAYGTGYDNTSGSGRVDALNAVYSVFTPAAPDLLAADDSGDSSTDNITNVTTPRFTGTVPVGSYVRLYADGNLVNTQQLGSNESTYTISSGALAAGTHQITVRVAQSATASGLSNSSSALSVKIDTTGPTIDYLGDVTPSPRNFAVGYDSFLVSDAGFAFFRPSITYANFTLTRNGVPVTLTSDMGVFFGISDYIIEGLDDFTSAPGTYVLTLNANGILDVAGNNGTGSASTTWVMDTTAPTVTDVVDVSPDPRTTAVSTVDVVFSELLNLSTFTYDDLSLTRSGSNVTLNGNVTTSYVSGTTYRISGLSALTGSVGTYVLTVNASGIQDQAGNSGTGSANDTWVNNQAPTFSVNSPASGTFISGNTVGIQWSATNVLPGSVYCLCYDSDAVMNGNEHWIVMDQSAQSGAFTYNWNTQGMAAGTYYVGGYLYQGSPIYSHLTTSFAIQAASFNVWGPGSGTFAAGTTIPISWGTDVTNPNETISLCYDTDTVFNGNETWIEVDQLPAVSGGHVYNWTSTSIPPRTYYLGGYLWNGSSATYAHITTPFTIVNFTVNSPASGTFARGTTVPIQFSAGNVKAGNVYCLCYDSDSVFNGNEHWITMDQTAQNGTYTYNWNTTGVTPGTYYVGGYLYQGSPVYSHLTTSITIAPPLRLAAPGFAPDHQSLAANQVLSSDDQLAPIVTEALRRWAAANGAQQALADVTVQVADLPGNLLGEAVGKTVLIDRDAAGYGWFIDSTPLDDAEYTPLASGQLVARSQTAADRHADLLTTVMHEMGHVLGYGDVDDGLMDRALPLGVRWPMATDSALAEYALA
ncbi:MAG: Ig-like domain-containing protein [Thermoguttaceae bacterium]